jgi:hypothetical protein
MGAVGVHGATRSVAGPQDNLGVAASGWARWSPVAAAAVGVHVIGGVGLVLANRDRIVGQSGVGANTVVRTVVTGAAIASTVYSGVLGRIWPPPPKRTRPSRPRPSPARRPQPRSHPPSSCGSCSGSPRRCSPC